ncbi:type II secretion system protein GspC [Paraglaciecola hydrolytica]|uniref:Type II secretion system protein GspC n=1 Tax=Paraglaciecola hydrolytica TaxID=1799789 RepID=A0A135ZZ69_9ALTE|nr:type II secretion system protein GspC [Paraglaciecola hydrolytica]KXI28271.1 type II secretion system protein GspC [Paraglaciecola hydrolytica]
MTVVNYNVNQVWLQLVKHQASINKLIVVLLCLFLLAYGAELTWRLLPDPVNNNMPTTLDNVSAVASSSNNVKLDLVAVKKLNLFGDLAAKPVIETQTVTEAPVTKLNLTLTGVVSSSSIEEGAAIIENRNQQQTYGLGEKIDGTNATLAEVYVDRVIIKNGPTKETLMLDGVDYSKPQSQITAAQPSKIIPLKNQDNEERRTLSSEAVQATRELQQAPANFTDYINISPHRVEGELSGYKVAPGKKPSLFKSAGLVNGDVITELNGLDLTDMQQSLEAMNAIRQAESIQMTVDRNGELLTIYLDLPQGEEEAVE